MHQNQQYTPYVFDTHAFIKTFVNAKSEEQRAEVIAKTISDVRQNNIIVEKTIESFDKDKDKLATKGDIEELRKTDIVEIKKDIVELKSEIGEIKKDIVGIKKDIDGIKKDIVELKSEIRDVKKDTEIALKGQEIRLIKWMFGMLTGQLALIILILKVFFKGTSGL